ncbi:hypothetical protein C4K26_1703 [Pseudomonas chlororaphis]|nr:hypothetical protein C4K26_1703 [Pseudomonas chlororaphis]
MLAKIVNDDAGILNEHGALAVFSRASSLLQRACYLIKRGFSHG